MTVNVSTTTDIETCQSIRATVFIHEQGVSVADEIDGRDNDAVHFLAMVDGMPIGTARMLVVDGVGKIGRVAVLAAHRGQGLGKAIMIATEAEARALGLHALKLGSQTSAISFYEKLGFVTEGDEFMDAGIPHRMMVRKL